LSAADPSPFGRFGTYLVLDPSTLNPESPVLDLLGVRALAAPPGSRSPIGAEVEARDAAPFSPEEDPAETGARARAAGTAARLVYDGPDMTLFERPGAFARFWLVSAVKPGGVEETRTAARDELAGTVFLSPEDAARIGTGPAPTSGTVRIAGLGPERFTVETEAPSPTVLASSQKLQRPYWRVFVDGIETAALAADGPFAAVALTAGRHRVEGRFEVPRIELLVSAAGALALLGVMIAARRPRPRTP